VVCLEKIQRNNNANMNTEQQDSTFISHEPCEKCGSSDARATYDDGHSYCFNCQAHEKEGGSNTESKHQATNGSPKVGRSGFLWGSVKELRNRSVTEATCRKWGYMVGTHNGAACHIASFYGEDGAIVAQKIRLPNKNFLALGDFSKAGLYGAHLWSGGKKLVITEGEIDALSVSQVQDYKWPVVSLPNGAAGAKKIIASNFDYLNQFEEIIFMFDNDDAGRKAAKECAAVLPVGKAKLAILPLKDANEMLVAGQGAEIIRAIWNAPVFRPDGIVDGRELWDTVSKELVNDGTPYPWEGLNALSHGIRKGEIVTLCAGSGIGKSQICKEIAFDLIQRDSTVGYIALEENVRRTSLGLMSLHLNKNILLNPAAADATEKRAAFEATVGSGKCFLYDHFGSMDSDNLVNRMRYMITGCGCEYIFLDHLSIVVSGLESGDERRFIDNTMTRLRSLVEELKFGLLLVSHLRRPDGRGHEEGGLTSLSQLRGSAGIAQLSDMVFGLERNQQDEEEPDVTRVRVLKNRWSGQTGVATSLEYGHDTGRLTELAMLETEV
jgi:twinkle protein